jgi:hypothetical protein
MPLQINIASGVRQVTDDIVWSGNFRKNAF